MSISSVIKTIQDIMRRDAGVDGDAQRLGQLSWLLFLKIFDAQEVDLEFELGSSYQTPIPEKYLWRNWAEDKQGITGDALLDFVNNELILDLKNYYLILIFVHYYYIILSFLYLYLLKQFF